MKKINARLGNPRTVIFICFILLAFTLLLYAQVPTAVGSEEPLELNIEQKHMKETTEMGAIEHEPDIVQVAGENLEIWMVPNRGLPIYKLFYRPEEKNILYSDPHPDPYEFEPGRFTFEFGGLYLLNPWNLRDQQPVLMHYEILREDPDVIEIEIAGEDPETGLVTRIIAKLELPGNRLNLNVELINESNEDLTFSELERIAIDASKDGELDIPVEEVDIIKSEEGWPEDEGISNWPAEWSSFNDMEGYGQFSADTNNFEISYGTFRLIKEFNSERDTKTEVTYVDEELEDYPFTSDLIRFETKLETDLKLEPGQSFDYDITLELESEDIEEEFPIYMAIFILIVVIVTIAITLVSYKKRS